MGRWVGITLQPRGVGHGERWTHSRAWERWRSPTCSFPGASCQAELVTLRERLQPKLALAAQVWWVLHGSAVVLVWRCWAFGLVLLGSVSSSSVWQLHLGFLILFFPFRVTTGL